MFSLCGSSEILICPYHLWILYLYGVQHLVGYLGISLRFIMQLYSNYFLTYDASKIADSFRETFFEGNFWFPA